MERRELEGSGFRFDLYTSLYQTHACGAKADGSIWVDPISLSASRRAVAFTESLKISAT